MRELIDYHHFNTHAPDSQLTNVERLERRVVQSLLAASALPDSERESSIIWELKHSSGTLQFARALASRRELDVDASSAGALLHDIYVIEAGKYNDHAALGAPIARRYMEDAGGFSEAAIQHAETLVGSHSDKHIWSDEPYAEFGKDIDVLDCFLYRGAFDYYLLHKPFPIFVHYLARAKAMWTDLGLPPDPIHTLLDEYEPGGWMTQSFAGPPPAAAGRAGTASSHHSPPPYVIDRSGLSLTIHAPGSTRADRGEITDHASTVLPLLSTTAAPFVLVFPVLDRWMPISTEAFAADLGLPPNGLPRSEKAPT